MVTVTGMDMDIIGGSQNYTVMPLLTTNNNLSYQSVNVTDVSSVIWQ